MTHVPCALGAALFIVGLAAADSPPSPFVVPPVEAIGKLARAGNHVPLLARDEARMLEDAADGKLDQFSLAEACLIVGGATDAEKRKVYLRTLDRIEKDARDATGRSRSAAETGERLLRFLHQGPMAKGYDVDQTDLHTVLDTEKFNCVSSSALYVVIGRRLGLNVQAVEVGEHMFVVLTVDSASIDVETTDPRGFDPGADGRTGPAKARRVGTRRPVGDPGLAGVVVYNHGVGLAARDRFAEAVRADLLALALDPANRQAAKNATAHLVNWPAGLIRAGRFPEAAAVLAAGRALAPAEDALAQNTRAVYDAWADRCMKRKDWAGAVRVYEQGLRDLPDDEHLKENLAYCRKRTRR